MERNNKIKIRKFQRSNKCGRKKSEEIKELGEVKEFKKNLATNKNK
jgi:hypothetical protein